MLCYTIGDRIAKHVSTFGVGECTDKEDGHLGCKQSNGISNLQLSVCAVWKVVPAPLINIIGVFTTCGPITALVELFLLGANQGLSGFETYMLYPCAIKLPLFRAAPPLSFFVLFNTRPGHQWQCVGGVCSCTCTP